MDAEEQINKFKKFIDLNYLDALLKQNRKGDKYLKIDFSLLSKFDPGLADMLLDQPEETIKAAELAIEQFDVESGFKARFHNLPETQNIMIRNIRSRHINKIFSIVGVVRQKSDVRPQVTAAKFECPSCGNVINVLQLDTQFKEPTRCGCGRKGKFRLISKELVDAQGIVLEESPETMEGGAQPKRMNVFLKDDLVSPISDKKTNPGSKIGVVGMVKEVPIVLRTGAKSTRFDLLIEANYVEPKEESFHDLQITQEEEDAITELSKDPDVYDKMAQSLAPSIYGHDKIKEALILQLMGGAQKERKDGVVSRGDIHVLLIGDPGAGKSALVKRVARIAPKARYVSGKGASAAGLTASVVKDEFLKGWSLEAGAMVLASDGVCCIDEMDKIGVEDRAAMHEAMENQTVSIAKANIQATLISRTTVLGAANPKFGRFDPYAVVGEQIDLPPTLINRFDLIFPIKDLPDRDKDDKLATHILSLHKDPIHKDPPIDTDLLRKYLAYSKRVKPDLTDEAIEEIKAYYLTMRAMGQGDEGIKSVPISARQLEALVRLSEASARVRLAERVERKDAKRAVELLNFCLTQVGLDPETGKIDIDRISTGITASQRSHIVTIKEIINGLESKIGKTIPIDDVVAEAKSKGIDESKTEEVIEKLKRSGDLFEPRRGFLSKI